MRFEVGNNALVYVVSGGIRPGEVVTITEAFEKAGVEIYKAETDDGRFGYFTKDMIGEVENDS